MNTQSERQTPSRDLAFVVKSQLFDADQIERALKRMAHEIVERNQDPSLLTVIGMQTGGVVFAERLTALLSEITKSDVTLGLLDVSFYRDDLHVNPLPQTSTTSIAHDLTDRSVILVDDVLFTGRTIRAALNALSDWGRPRSVQLAVIVDRGHRELPIRPDYVGKNLPTAVGESIRATIEGVWIGTKATS